MATNINVRVDEDVKRKAETLFNELGMNMSTAINVFLKKSIAFGGIPFEVSVDPFYSESNMKALNESIEQMKTGKTVTKTIEELEGLSDE